MALGSTQCIWDASFSSCWADGDGWLIDNGMSIMNSRCQIFSVNWRRHFHIEPLELIIFPWSFRAMHDVALLQVHLVKKSSGSGRKLHLKGDGGVGGAGIRWPSGSNPTWEGIKIAAKCWAVAKIHQLHIKGTNCKPGESRGPDRSSCDSASKPDPTFNCGGQQVSPIRCAG